MDPMTTMKHLVPIALLLLAACSGSDPKTLADEGNAALGKGDAKGAFAKFDEALVGLDTSHDQYVRVSIGRCEALAETDGPAAVKSFLELAVKVPAKITETDYSLICSRLLQGGFTLEAIDVLDAGKKRFVGSKKMEETLVTVQAAAKKQSTPDALKKLASLGYAGD